MEQTFLIIQIQRQPTRMERLRARRRRVRRNLLAGVIALVSVLILCGVLAVTTAPAEVEPEDPGRLPVVAVLETPKAETTKGALTMDWDVVYRDRWSGRRRSGTVCASSRLQAAAQARKEAASHGCKNWRIDSVEPAATVRTEEEAK